MVNITYIDTVEQPEEVYWIIRFDKHPEEGPASNFRQWENAGRPVV